MYPTIASQRNINVENPQTVPKIASTLLTVGMWLQYDGAGAAEPLAPSSPVLGLNLTPVPASDASNDLITYDGIDVTVDRWLMPVTSGTADASMIGSPFDVDTNSYGLDVSGAGTQFEVTKVISATVVEVKVLLVS